MLADWDSASIAGVSFPCVADEPFGEDVGVLGVAPEIETDRLTWLSSGGGLGVTVVVDSSTDGLSGTFVAREVRILEDGAMVRVRLEST